MDEKTSRHFAEIIELAQSVFESVTYEIDATPNRSILRIKAEYGKYQILVTELLSDGVRKYRYYVMHGNWVEAGFDNAPDTRHSPQIRENRRRTYGGKYSTFASGRQNTTIFNSGNDI